MTLIVNEIKNFVYYNAPRGCARILIGNMPLSAAKIRRSKRQNEKTFVVCHTKYYEPGGIRFADIICVVHFHASDIHICVFYQK